METPAEKLERIRAELKRAEQSDLEDIGYNNGDCFDEDDGSYLGNLDLRDEVEMKEKDTLPAKISVYFDGYFYIFQPVSRYKAQGEGEHNAEENKS